MVKINLSRTKTVNAIKTEDLREEFESELLAYDPNQIDGIDLSSQPVESKGAKIMCEIIDTYKLPLTSLNVLGNLIGDEGLGLVIELNVFNNLTKINLSLNLITSQGALLLSNALRHNSSLKEVILLQNSLEDEGVKRICEALEGNQSLTSLDLSKNNITAEGAHSVAQLLATTKLEFLDVSLNPLGVRGILSIFEPLKNNQHLRKLNLNRCKSEDPQEMSEGEIKIIYNVAESKNALKELNMTDSYLTLAERKDLSIILSEKNSEVEGPIDAPHNMSLLVGDAYSHWAD